MSLPPATARSRYHDLDALRGGLMIWGIAVHTSTLAPTVVFRELARISGFVRMEAFFIISGLLSALLLQKYGAWPTLRKRFPTLVVPLALGLLVLNPITNYLVYCYHNPPIPLAQFLAGGAPEPVRGPIYWHLHLWFLIALLLYVIVTPFLKGLVDRAAQRFEDRVRHVRPQLAFAALCILLPLACLGTRVIFEFLVEPHVSRTFRFTLLSTFYYLPFFILGLAMFRLPWLLGMFSRIRVVHLLAAAISVAIAHQFFDALPKLAAEVTLLLAETYLAVVLSALLFSLAQRYFASEHPWVRTFSNAAYSIYLFHFLVLYVCAHALRPWLGSGYVMLCTAALTTLVLTLLLHHLVIERFALLRWLCNGRWAGRSRRPRADPLISEQPSSLLADEPRSQALRS